MDGFNGHVATGRLLVRRTVKWRAFGWAVVQLVYDEELGLLHGMYGSVEGRNRGPAHHQEGGADGLLMPLNRVIGPVRVHVDNQGSIDGLRKRESKCIKSRAGDADFMITNLGRITGSGRKRHFGGSRACKGASHEERKETYVAV